MLKFSSKVGWLVAGLGLAYLAFGYWLDSYRVPRYYRAFRGARLHGSIAQLSATKLGVRLRLANYSQTYHFFPRDGRGYNQAYEFTQLAQPGTSVYKASGSATRYLRVKGQTYSFTGEKPR